VRPSPLARVARALPRPRTSPHTPALSHTLQPGRLKFTSASCRLRSCLSPVTSKFGEGSGRHLVFVLHANRIPKLRFVSKNSACQTALHHCRGSLNCIVGLTCASARLSVVRITSIITNSCLSCNDVIAGRSTSANSVDLSWSSARWPAQLV
jgi:hypothetical protein